MKTKSAYSRGNENKRLNTYPPLYTLHTALENAGKVKPRMRLDSMPIKTL